MMLVVAIGTNDADSMKLANLGRRAVAKCGSAGVRFEYVEVGAHDRINGVDKLPALVIDGHVVAQGTVPKLREVQAALADAIATTVEDVDVDAAPGHSDAGGMGSHGVVPICDGCGRGCPLDAPGCRVGRARAQELGIAPRR